MTMKRRRQLQLALSCAQRRKRESLRLWEAVLALRRAKFCVFRAGGGDHVIGGVRHDYARLLALAAEHAARTAEPMRRRA